MTTDIPTAQLFQPCPRCPAGSRLLMKPSIPRSLKLPHVTSAWIRLVGEELGSTAGQLSPHRGDGITNSRTGMCAYKCQSAEWSHRPQEVHLVPPSPQQMLGSEGDPQPLPPFFPPPTQPPTLPKCKPPLDRAGQTVNKNGSQVVDNISASQRRDTSTYWAICRLHTRGLIVTAAFQKKMLSIPFYR